MIRLTTFVTALFAALVVAASSIGAPAATTLQGTVGPGFTITLKKSGKKVTKLKRGTYKIVVSDKSAIHNFHLKGPGVNKVITATPFVGKKSVTVKLKAGKYTYVCDPHTASMHGTFKVT